MDSLTHEHSASVCNVNFESPERMPVIAGWQTPRFWAARWRGTIRITTGGTYSFTLAAGIMDSAALWINHTKVGSFDCEGGEMSVDLPAGDFCFQVLYSDYGWTDAMTLKYKGPDSNGEEVVVPDSAFVPNGCTSCDELPEQPTLPPPVDIFGPTKYTVYIIDKSGSMNAQDIITPDGRITRDEAAVKDLSRSLHQLDAAHEFTVVTFNHTAQAAFGRDLRPATAENVAAAITFISRPATGKTCYSCALNKAWQVQGEIHRMVFMSDGEPTAGIKDTAGILDLVESENNNVPIDTILFAIESEKAQATMEGIANQTHGVYRKVGLLSTCEGFKCNGFISVLNQVCPASGCTAELCCKPGAPGGIVEYDQLGDHSGCGTLHNGVVEFHERCACQRLPSEQSIMPFCKQTCDEDPNCKGYVERPAFGWDTCQLATTSACPTNRECHKFNMGIVGPLVEVLRPKDTYNGCFVKRVPGAGSLLERSASLVEGFAVIKAHLEEELLEGVPCDATVEPCPALAD